ncbi:hypothetical protein E2N92_00860 [Methanofollis formosanus]|uniref:Uncharacterized protein n=1 Tax=Methanofollis formosanus TaxID=299308 RepID=A0A8G0ZYG9_9EURY|nr:hypothetical protein [Methanofollis formosanus]QYZ78081.1 hypothetical protein E2N92_00860 [Methanofollis formosanus]
MTSQNPEQNPDPPICLPAYLIPGKKSIVAVWCPHCGLLHHHGEGPGRLFFHRMAHCVCPADGEDASPYRASGYFVIPTGRTLSVEKKTPGAWARPFSYTEAVGHIVAWYLRAGYPDEEITGALAGFERMYESTAEKYLAQGEMPVL